MAQTEKCKPSSSCQCVLTMINWPYLLPEGECLGYEGHRQPLQRMALTQSLDISLSHTGDR